MVTLQHTDQVYQGNMSGLVEDFCTIKPIASPMGFIVLFLVWNDCLVNLRFCIVFKHSLMLNDFN